MEFIHPFHSVASQFSHCSCESVTRAHDIQRRWGTDSTYCSFSRTLGKEQQSLLSETISFTIGIRGQYSQISGDDIEQGCNRVWNIRFLSRLVICRNITVRALSDIACLTRIDGQRLKKLGGLDKVAEDLHRRQGLPFQDTLNAALLGYNFND
jgi:hypothetical protein